MPGKVSCSEVVMISAEEEKDGEKTSGADVCMTVPPDDRNTCMRSQLEWSETLYDVTVKMV